MISSSLTTHGAAAAELVVGTHSIYCYVLKFNATKSEASLHDISVRIESIFSPEYMPLEAFNINFIQFLRARRRNAFDVLFEFQ